MKRINLPFSLKFLLVIIFLSLSQSAYSYTLDIFSPEASPNPVPLYEKTTISIKVHEYSEWFFPWDSWEGAKRPQVKVHIDTPNGTKVIDAQFRSAEIWPPMWWIISYWPLIIWYQQHSWWYFDAVWDMTDSGGKPVPPGGYNYRVTASVDGAFDLEAAPKPIISPVRVELDPGHGKYLKPDGTEGYRRPPSPTYGDYEDNHNLDIAGRIVEWFCEGVEVGHYELHLTRIDEWDLHNDWREANKMRVEKAVDDKAHLFVSTHCNAGDSPAHGTEVFYYQGDASGQSLATDILNRLVTLNLRNRGVKSNASWPMLKGCNNNDITVALIEAAFLTNWGLCANPAHPQTSTTQLEENRLHDPDFRSEVGDLIHKGVEDYAYGQWDF